jgi:hypothetical protein
MESMNNIASDHEMSKEMMDAIIRGEHVYFFMPMYVENYNHLFGDQGYAVCLSNLQKRDGVTHLSYS